MSLLLLSAGCSFTYGNELSDDTPDSHSQKSWSALLANKLGYDYATVAKPGASNQTIARSLIDHITHSTSLPQAVAVMWTFTSRFEYNDRIKGDFIQVSRESAKTNDSIRSYYEVFGDDEINELYVSLSSFFYLQMALTAKDIPFIFTTADSSPLKRHFAVNPNTSISALIKNIDWSKWYWVDHMNDEDGFYAWGKRNHPVGPKGHPLDQAHQQLAADMLPLALTSLR